MIQTSTEIPYHQIDPIHEQPSVLSSASCTLIHTKGKCFQLIGTSEPLSKLKGNMMKILKGEYKITIKAPKGEIIMKITATMSS